MHIAKVDLLRGVAIITVFFFHCYLELFTSYVIPKFEDGFIVIDSLSYLFVSFSPISLGWSGVELFFIISGFLIHLNFLQSDKSFNITTFYSKRFWRIYPPYLLALLFFSISTPDAISYLRSGFGLIDFCLHALLTHNLTHRTFASINPSFWSLALEAQLYLLYPILLILRNKIGIKNVTLFFIFLSLLFLILQNTFVTENTKTLPIVRLFVHQSVLFYWFVWALGAYLAEVYHKKQRIFGNHAFRFVIFLFICFTFCKVNIYTAKFSIYIATIFWLSVFEWILYSEKVNINSSIIKSIISVGLCSYSIYLFHQPFLGKLLGIFDLSHINPYLKIVSILPVFLVIYIIAQVLYWFVELPSIELGKRIRSRKSQKKRPSSHTTISNNVSVE
ncbi:acyltransferase family protein [Spirosoma daeguense]